MSHISSRRLLFVLFVSLSCVACRGSSITSSHAALVHTTTTQCTRDENALQALKTPGGQIACVYDDACPIGAYCDLGLGVCTWDCDGASVVCPSNEVCDCRGHCGGVAPPPPDALRLTAAPQSLELPIPSATTPAQAKPVDLTLTSSAAAMPAAPTVTITADDGTIVSCDGTHGGDPGATMVAQCQLPAWSFTGSSGKWTVTNRIWIEVRPSVAAGSNRYFDVGVASPALANPLQSVTVHALDVVPPAGTIADGDYDGFVFLQEGYVVRWRLASKGPLPPTQPPVPGDATAREVPIPVTAYARNGKVVLVDATRLLSPTGRLRLVANTDTWLGDGASTISDAASGSYVVATTPHFGTVDASGHVVGNIYMQLPSPQNARAIFLRYDLVAKGALTPASCSAAPCASGSYCDPDTQLCLPGSAPPSPPPVAPSSLRAPSPRRWWQAVQTDTANAGAPDPSDVAGIYDYSRWSGSDALPDRMLPLAISDEQSGAGGLGASLPDDFGFNQCKAQFSTYLSPYGWWGWQFVLRQRQDPLGCVGANDGLPGVTGLQVGSDAYNTALCQKLYVHYRSYSSAVGCLQWMPDDATQKPWRKLLVPCMTDTRNFQGQTIAPFRGDGVTPSYRGDAACEDFGKRAIEHGVAASDWKDYVTRYCELADEDLQLYYGGKTSDVRHYDVFMCPVTDTVFGSATGTDAAVRLACYEPEYNSHPLPSSYMTSVQLPLEGDLLCARSSNAASATAPLLTLRDRITAGQAGEVTNGDMLKTCMQELTQPAPALDGSWHADFWNASSCINQPRLVGAIFAGSTVPNNFVNHLVQQWIAVHDFVAAEAMEEYQLGVVTNPQLSVDDVQTAMDPVLDQLEREWALLLDADISTRLLATPGDVLARADYRLDQKGWSGSATADQDQAVGLPTAIAEGLSQHLAILDQYLEQAARAAYAQCYEGGASSRRDEALRRGSSALRTMLAVEQLAVQLRAKVVTTPAWGPRYDKAIAAYRGALGKVLQRLRAIAVCANPLGLADDMVPLFFGDATGEAAKAFAASDFLLAKARPEVDSATSLYTTAKASWDQSIRDVQQKEDQQARIAELQNEYGNPVADLCGLKLDGAHALAAFDTANGGTMAPNTCFVDQTRPECNGSEVGPSDCYHGTLGETLLAVWGAKKDIDIARTELDEHMKKYDLQMSHCALLLIDAGKKKKAREDHDHEMESLRNQKFSADLVATIADHAAHAAGGGPLGLGAAMADTVAAIAKGTSLMVDKEMAAADQKEADLMSDLYAETDAQNCSHEADMLYVGIDSLTEQIRRRGIDLSEQMTRLDDLEVKVQNSVSEGLAAVQRETNRTSAALQHLYWLNQDVRNFQWELEYARLYTYLTLIAVEYEFQYDSGQRGAVLMATRPDQLDVILKSLQPDNLRTIDGKRVDDTVQVVSLRDDILKMSTTGGDPQQTPGQRFGARLWSPANAVYDTKGEYLGQGIRFQLNPVGALEQRCAERVWAVDASPQGDFGVALARLPIALYKRKQFASQWCQIGDLTLGDGSPMQVAQKCPVGALTMPGKPYPFGDETVQWTSADILAAPNKTENEFYSFSDGESTELAGQGIYGEYLLLFPANALPPGFPLENMEDIYLRFEYTSAANDKPAQLPPRPLAKR